MNEKKADNIIIDNKEKISEIDNEIYDKKNQIRKINSMQEDFASISKSVNKSIELLSRTLSGNKVNNMLNDMYNNNNNFLTKVSNILDEEKSVIKKNLNDLYFQKNKVEKPKQKEE